MVIIITGASHTWKTYLAQMMLKKYGYPYLSIDHLKMGLIRSKNTSLSVEDDDALTEYLWPIVSEIIKTNIENEQNLIVEGCYVPFNFRDGFSEEYNKEIKFICLSMTKDYLLNHFLDIKSHANVIEKRLDDDCNLDVLIKDNEKYMMGFALKNENVSLIDSDFERVMDELVNRFAMH